ncbi:hypothetical protein, partial [Prescottella agglutinans]
MLTRAPSDIALAAAVADAVAAALPAFAEAVTAAVLADPRIASAAAEPAAAAPLNTEQRERLKSLLSANPKHRPERPEVWLDTVAAHYPAAADALAWAWSERCPTDFWRRLRGAPAPAKNPGRSRRGELDQVIAEHHLATAGGRGHLVAGLDGAVEQVRAAISEHHRVRVTYTWRRGLVEAAGSVGDDLEKAIAVIVWCLRTRPHWQRTITQPPSRVAFEKMLGDWHADGQGWSISEVTDRALAEQLRNLGGRWMRYQTERGGGAHPSYARTGRNLHRALAGDGIEPVSAGDIDALLRWWFDEGNARFHIRDADFPGPDVVARALLAMRT